MDYHSFGEDYDEIHQKLSAEEAYISGFLQDATKNNIVLANVTFKMRDATVKTFAFFVDWQGRIVMREDIPGANVGFRKVVYESRAEPRIAKAYATEKTDFPKMIATYYLQEDLDSFHAAIVKQFYGFYPQGTNLELNRYEQTIKRDIDELQRKIYEAEQTLYGFIHQKTPGLTEGIAEILKCFSVLEVMSKEKEEDPLIFQHSGGGVNSDFLRACKNLAKFSEELTQKTEFFMPKKKVEGYASLVSTLVKKIWHSEQRFLHQFLALDLGSLDDEGLEDVESVIFNMHSRLNVCWTCRHILARAQSGLQSKIREKWADATCHLLCSFRIPYEHKSSGVIRYFPGKNVFSLTQENFLSFTRTSSGGEDAQMQYRKYRDKFIEDKHIDNLAGLLLWYGPPDGKDIIDQLGELLSWDQEKVLDALCGPLSP